MSSALPSPGPWDHFAQDPRRPEAAGLRASDRDRDVVLGVLGEAYADGRLDRMEYDERSGRAAQAKTLGELPALVADLVPDRSPRRGTDLATASPDELRAMAVRRWESHRRQALTGLLVPSLICWIIWVVSGAGFPWPVFVMLGTGMNLLRVLINKQDIVDEEQRRLERKQRKALEGPQRPDSEHD